MRHDPIKLLSAIGFAHLLPTGAAGWTKPVIIKLDALSTTFLLSVRISSLPINNIMENLATAIFSTPNF